MDTGRAGGVDGRAAQNKVGSQVGMVQDEQQLCGRKTKVGYHD